MPMVLSCGDRRIVTVVTGTAAHRRTIFIHTCVLGRAAPVLRAQEAAAPMHWTPLYNPVKRLRTSGLSSRWLRSQYT